MAKPITIYGRILSPFVARVALAARAKGLSYDLKLPDGGIKTPGYLKLNPLGKIPTIVDGKNVLFESTIIVDYLDSKSRAKKLVPSAAKAAGQVRLAGAVAGEYVQAPAIDLFRHKRGNPPNPVNVPEATASMHKGLDALEKVLAKGKFAGGAKFSYADCFVAPALQFATTAARLYEMGDIFAGRPKLGKYWRAIQKDKVSKPVIDAMNALVDDAIAGRLPPMY